MRPYYFDFEQSEARRALAIAMARPVAHHRLPPPRKPSGLLHAAIALVRVWYRRASERRQLAALDHRMLRDIGVTPVEAEQEFNKPFWKP